MSNPLNFTFDNNPKIIEAVKEFTKTATCQSSHELVEELRLFYRHHNSRLNTYCSSCIREAMRWYTQVHPINVEPAPVATKKKKKDGDA
jgi:hypothetical protein